MNIWQTLSVLDCSEHVDKKGQFSYLSWTWAWSMVKDNYPEAQYKIEADIVYPDATMEVRCTVTVLELSHTMWLPVLDFKNKAIRNPNAFDVNSSRMRCFVKCLAMFGLGHYIYAGESLPSDAPSETVNRASAFTNDQKKRYHELLDNDKAYEFYLFVATLDAETAAGLYNSFDEGKTSSGKKKATALEQKGNGLFIDAVNKIKAKLDTHDISVTEETNEMTQGEKSLLRARLSEYEVQQLAGIKKAQMAA
jgi:hypothetical protein